MEASWKTLVARSEQLNIGEPVSMTLFTPWLRLKKSKTTSSIWKNCVQKGAAVTISALTEIQQAVILAHWDRPVVPATGDIESRARAFIVLRIC